MQSNVKSAQSKVLPFLPRLHQQMTGLSYRDQIGRQPLRSRSTIGDKNVDSIFQPVITIFRRTHSFFRRLSISRTDSPISNKSLNLNASFLFDPQSISCKRAPAYECECLLKVRPSLCQAWNIYLHHKLSKMLIFSNLKKMLQHLKAFIKLSH